MKTFIGFIGLFSLIVSGIMCYTGYTTFNDASTVMQQGVGMQYIIYSGILLLCGICGIGLSYE